MHRGGCAGETMKPTVTDPHALSPPAQTAMRVMMRTMLQALVRSAGRWLDAWNREPRPESGPPTTQPPAPARTPRLEPLERVLLTDGVCHTLFEEYEAHRRGPHGEDETGWVLLGIRDVAEAVALATLPAGTQAHASAGHVKFNDNAQAMGSRIIRQRDKRLNMLGVVHTHPGSLRHPSDSDYRGDSAWVGNLRGAEGIFAIGTADGTPEPGTPIGRQPRPNMQCLGKLRFCWYALQHGDRQYRPLPVELTLGPDLARPLHVVWPVIETYAEQLERLYRQQTGMTFEVIDSGGKPALLISLPLAERGDRIQIVLEEKQAHYYLLRRGELIQADLPTDRVDRAVYLLLAELTAESG